MKLQLDEKKIRKGRAVGLPYVGSKKKISKKIIEIIKQNFGTDKTIYDIFGGGGAITAECLINGLDVVYNDLDKNTANMIRLITNNNREWIKTLIVSRDEFFNILNKEDKTPDDNLKLLINSFGNNRKTYLYSKEYSDIKYQLTVDIINETDNFNNYKKSISYKKYINNIVFARNQQLQRLQQIELFHDLKIKHVNNEDYHYFSNIKNQIIYLDPPYENSVVDSYKTAELDYKKFYNWVCKMSQSNIVLLSGYECSDNRFEEVFEFENAHSTFSSGVAGKRTEKLFMVK